MDKIEIEATLPTTRTAFAFTGEGDAKISLDTDAGQLGNVIPLLVTMRGKLLKVTFEVAE